MDQSEIEGLIKELKSKDRKIKLNAILRLRDLAKKGVNVRKGLEQLKKSLISKDKEVYEPSAEVFLYFYQHFVSLYCSNYGSLPETLRDLKSSNKSIREKSASYLQHYSIRSSSRQWKYIRKEEMESIIEKLNNGDKQQRLDAAKQLFKLIKDNFEIQEAIPHVKGHLEDSDEEVRWMCAEVLERYIGIYTDTSYSYTMKNIREYSPEKKFSFAENMGYAAQYDIVSDRDERDISFALPKLTLLISDDIAKVRKAAIQAIRTAQGEHDISIAIPSIINVLQNIKYKNIHSPASGILKEAIKEGFKLKPYITDLRELLSSESTSNDLKKEIVLIIRQAVEEKLDISDEISLLESLLSSSNEEVKFGAADTLAYFYINNKSWKMLTELMEHEDKDVRQEAAGTVEHVKSNIEVSPILPKLKELLKDEDEEVRFVAARSLFNKFETLEDIQPAIEIIIDYAIGEEGKLRNNAFQVINRFFRENIMCKPKIPQSKWHHFKSLVEILESVVKKKEKALLRNSVESLTQYYVHEKKWTKIRDLLRKCTNKNKLDIMFRLTSCGWSDCKVDVSELIPDLLELRFSHKNEKVRDAAERKIEDIVKIKNTPILIQEIQKYNIDKRWKLEEKLRKKSKYDEIRNFEREFYDLEDLKDKLEYITPLLTNENAIIKEWATSRTWDILYKDKDLFGPLVPILIENLKDKDPFVRDTTTSILGGAAREKYDVSKAIPIFKELMSDESEKIRHTSAAALSSAAEYGIDITEAIPELIKNIEIDNSDVSYFCSLAPRFYVNSYDRAQFVLEELDNAKVDKRKKETKRLIEKCQEYADQINDTLEKLILAYAEKNGISGPIRKAQGMDLLLYMWKDHWKLPISNHIVEIMINQVFFQHRFGSWKENLIRFFREAKKKFSLTNPGLKNRGLSEKEVEKVIIALKESLELAEQDEWDSIITLT